MLRPPNIYHLFEEADINDYETQKKTCVKTILGLIFREHKYDERERTQIQAILAKDVISDSDTKKIIGLCNSLVLSGQSIAAITHDLEALKKEHRYVKIAGEFKSYVDKKGAFVDIVTRRQESRKRHRKTEGKEQTYKPSLLYAAAQMYEAKEDWESAAAEYGNVVAALDALGSHNRTTGNVGPWVRFKRSVSGCICTDTEETRSVKLQKMKAQAKDAQRRMQMKQIEESQAVWVEFREKKAKKILALLNEDQRRNVDLDVEVLAGDAGSFNRDLNTLIEKHSFWYQLSEEEKKTKGFELPDTSEQNIYAISRCILAVLDDLKGLTDHEKQYFRTFCIHKAFKDQKAYALKILNAYFTYYETAISDLAKGLETVASEHYSNSDALIARIETLTGKTKAALVDMRNLDAVLTAGVIEILVSENKLPANSELKQKLIDYITALRNCSRLKRATSHAPKLTLPTLSMIEVMAEMRNHDDLPEVRSDLHLETLFSDTDLRGYIINEQAITDAIHALGVKKKWWTAAAAAENPFRAKLINEYKLSVLTICAKSEKINIKELELFAQLNDLGQGLGDDAVQVTNRLDFVRLTGDQLRGILYRIGADTLFKQYLDAYIQKRIYDLTIEQEGMHIEGWQGTALQTMITHHRNAVADVAQFSRRGRTEFFATAEAHRAEIDLFNLPQDLNLTEAALSIMTPAQVNAHHYNQAMFFYRAYLEAPESRMAVLAKAMVAIHKCPELTTAMRGNYLKMVEAVQQCYDENAVLETHAAHIEGIIGANLDNALQEAITNKHNVNHKAVHFFKYTLPPHLYAKIEAFKLAAQTPATLQDVFGNNTQEAKNYLERTFEKDSVTQKIDAFEDAYKAACKPSDDVGAGILTGGSIASSVVEVDLSSEKARLRYQVRSLGLTDLQATDIKWRYKDISDGSRRVMRDRVKLTAYRKRELPNLKRKSGIFSKKRRPKPQQNWKLVPAQNQSTLQKIDQAEALLTHLSYLDPVEPAHVSNWFSLAPSAPSAPARVDVEAIFDTEIDRLEHQWVQPLEDIILTHGMFMQYGEADDKKTASFIGKGVGRKVKEVFERYHLRPDELTSDVDLRYSTDKGSVEKHTFFDDHAENLGVVLRKMRIPIQGPIRTPNDVQAQMRNYLPKWLDAYRDQFMKRGKYYEQLAEQYHGTLYGLAAREASKKCYKKVLEVFQHLTEAAHEGLKRNEAIVQAIRFDQRHTGQVINPKSFIYQVATERPELLQLADVTETVRLLTEKLNEDETAAKVLRNQRYLASDVDGSKTPVDFVKEQMIQDEQRRKGAYADQIKALSSESPDAIKATEAIKLMDSFQEELRDDHVKSQMTGLRNGSQDTRFGSKDIYRKNKTEIAANRRYLYRKLMGVAPVDGWQNSASFPKNDASRGYDVASVKYLKNNYARARVMKAYADHLALEGGPSEDVLGIYREATNLLANEHSFDATYLSQQIDSARISYEFRADGGIPAADFRRCIPDADQHPRMVRDHIKTLLIEYCENQVISLDSEKGKRTAEGGMTPDYRVKVKDVLSKINQVFSLSKDLYPSDINRLCLLLETVYSGFDKLTKADLGMFENEIKDSVDALEFRWSMVTHRWGSPDERFMMQNTLVQLYSWRHLSQDGDDDDIDSRFVTFTLFLSQLTNKDQKERMVHLQANMLAEHYRKKAAFSQDADRKKAYYLKAARVSAEVTGQDPDQFCIQLWEVADYLAQFTKDQHMRALVLAWDKTLYTREQRFGKYADRLLGWHSHGNTLVKDQTDFLTNTFSVPIVKGPTLAFEDIKSCLEVQKIDLSAAVGDRTKIKLNAFKRSYQETPYGDHSNRYFQEVYGHFKINMIRDLYHAGDTTEAYRLAVRELSLLAKLHAISDDHAYRSRIDFYRTQLETFYEEIIGSWYQKIFRLDENGKIQRDVDGNVEFNLGVVSTDGTDWNPDFVTRTNIDQSILDSIKEEYLTDTDNLLDTDYDFQRKMLFSLVPTTLIDEIYTVPPHILSRLTVDDKERLCDTKAGELGETITFWKPRYRVARDRAFYQDLRQDLVTEIDTAFTTSNAIKDALFEPMDQPTVAPQAVTIYRWHTEILKASHGQNEISSKLQPGGYQLLPRILKAWQSTQSLITSVGDRARQERASASPGQQFLGSEGALELYASRRQEEYFASLPGKAWEKFRFNEFIIDAMISFRNLMVFDMIASIGGGGCLYTAIGFSAGFSILAEPHIFTAFVFAYSAKVGLRYIEARGIRKSRRFIETYRRGLPICPQAASPNQAISGASQVSYIRTA